MRTRKSLRLVCFLLFTRLLLCCPLQYSLPCRNHGRPIIRKLCHSLIPKTRTLLYYGCCPNTCHQLLVLLCRYLFSTIRPFCYTLMDYGSLFSLNFLMVDLAGVEPASRTLFYLLHTAITFIILSILGQCNQ